MQDFSFGAIERAVCPTTTLQLQRSALEAEEAASSTESGEEFARRGRRFVRPAQPDPFTSLPLERLEQILDDCDLADLFRLSQTSQRLYTGLRSKSKRMDKLWLNAVKRSWPLDERQPGIMNGSRVSPLSLAYQLFGVHCQFCAKSTKQDRITLFSPLGIRCCSHCAEKYLLTKDQIKKRYPRLHPASYDCTLTTLFRFFYDPQTGKLSTPVEELTIHSDSEEDRYNYPTSYGSRRFVPMSTYTAHRESTSPKATRSPQKQPVWYLLQHVLQQNLILTTLARLDLGMDPGVVKDYTDGRSAMMGHRRKLNEMVMEAAWVILEAEEQAKQKKAKQQQGKGKENAVDVLYIDMTDSD